jgi:DNA-binding transcriptional ArsR family regulator
MRSQAVTRPSDAVFYAVADPTRRAVLDLLRRSSQPAGQIARSFPVSRPAISRHLRVLLRADLIRQRREGRYRVYQLNPAPLNAMDRWLEAYRAFWTTKLAGLKSFVESGAAPSHQRSGRRTTRTRKTK